MNSFSTFLSLRYLRPKRTFVSVITLISVGGVILGVWILSTVIAIFTGYNVQMRETILGFQPHLIVEQRDPILNWRELSEKIMEHPEVVDVSPYAKGQLGLDFNNRVLVVRQQALQLSEGGAITEKLRGLVEGTGEKPREGRVFTGEGELDFSDDNIVVGRALADGMGITVGDTVNLFSLANANELLAAQQEGREVEEFIVPEELTVTGIYDAGRFDFESEYVFVPLEVGQTLYNLVAENSVHGVAVHLADPYHADRVKMDLLDMLEPPLNVQSWVDMNKALFDAVAMERLMMYFLLSIIMVVAGFCIMNTMITVTTQKRREIGLLKAVGARTSQIVGVFLGQGIVVGLAGTVCGLLLTFFTLLFRKELVEGLARGMGMTIFDPSLYMLYELPAVITTVDIVVISGGAFLACALSSLAPAWFAARMDAARALRNESSV